MRLIWQFSNTVKLVELTRTKKGHCYCLVVKFLFSQYGVHSNMYCYCALKSYFTVGRLWKWKGSICFKASGTNLARALLFEMPFALRSSRAIALWTTWQNWPWVQHFDLWQLKYKCCCHQSKICDGQIEKNLVWKNNHDWSWLLIPWISM